MEKNNEILNELQSISPLVAAIGKANVFSVPDGYFDSISNTVIMSVNEEFPAENISNFLNDTVIPAGYFENLSDSILHKIKKQEAGELPPIFSAIKKDKLFHVPGDYFETLADTIFKKIQEEETLPAVLNNLKTVQPFKVPENYFSDLPVNILNKIKQASGAKIVAMPKQFPILRYAAAAVIIGALALGVYKYSNQPLVNTTDSVASVKLDSSIEKGKIMDDKKFNETLSNLSADDILNYLQRNGNEADIAVLSSNVEETSLPNEEDYLLDEKTLDIFLKDLETKTN